MIKVIAIQQWQRLLRHKLLISLIAVVSITLVLLSFIHWQLLNNAQETQQHWQTQADEYWLNQPDRHPHRVAHYGHVVFRPHSPLSFLDAGTAPFTGNFLYLEAHKQNAAAVKNYPINATSLAFGFPSVSTFFWIIWPLVLIAIAHTALSDDKQMGRNTWLTSLGVSKLSLMTGRALIYLIINTLVIILIGVIASVFIATSDSSSWDTWLSLGFILSVFWLYAALWVLMILAVSSVSRNNLQSLLSILAFWFVSVVLIPKIAAPISETLYPIPSRANFDSSIHEDALKVGDSHNPDDPYFARLKQETLDEYGVDNVDDLPVNWNGIVMSAGEKITSDIYQQHWCHLTDTFNKHEKIHTALGILSPTLIASKIVTHFSGNNRYQSEDFEAQAENFRFRLIQSLNQIHTDHINRENDREQKVSAEIWQQMKLFDYQKPTLNLNNQTLLLAVLAFWGLLSLGLFIGSGRKSW